MILWARWKNSSIYKLEGNKIEDLISMDFSI